MISDIHANPAALERALADVERCGAEKVVCAGDVVGYGPDPVGA
ncbi:MAG: metallophosphoesterase, partial [Kiritimatiellae bacterium]|nr:metallophosphoesterase [Kiritimatiellia bacterium]